jgi:type II secretory pathway pseudopilin PulG
VTEGHVRAARLRRLQPWIIALAIVLLVAGFIVIGLAPNIQPATSVASRVQQRLMQIHARAEAAFTALAKLPPRVDDPQRLPPDREIREVVDALLASLTKSGDLPEGNLTFKQIDEDAFWAGNWGTERVSYLESGDTYLLGAYAHVGAAGSTQPVRWVGAVKKIDGKWQYASIGWGGLYMPPGLPSVPPQSIAVSLDPFLPSLPETTQK